MGIEAQRRYHGGVILRARTLACLSILAVGLASGWLAPASADDDRATPSAALTWWGPVYRLLPDDSPDREPWMTFPTLVTETAPALDLAPGRPTETPVAAAGPSPRAAEPAFWAPPYPRTPLPGSPDVSGVDASVASLTMDASQPEQPEAEVPRWPFLERHRLLLSTLLPIASMAAVSSNALLGYNTNHSFQIHREGWFGPDTANGGSDKASHLTDYFVVAHLFEDVYRMLGYSEKSAILWGFGVALVTGLANETSDGFTHYGFSWEDLTMDVAGAATASVVSLTRTRDLLGMRTSHLPSSNYSHDIYSADLKLSGLGQRLGINIGPLRWLLFSVTYGSKGYRVPGATERQRLLGLEIGLNLQQILNDLGVRRSTWWGYTLHLVADNVRFPFTAVGMRLDLNDGKWHGPNSGNYD